MPEINISGIPVNFPFEPYDVQKDYMASVIRCLQNGHNGILESPTGTGKTLCLLCSSLAWLMMCKAKTQAESLGMSEDDLSKGPTKMKFLSSGFSAAGNVKVEPYAWGGTPKIYYASRTHSQLTQVIQEFKRTAYAHIKSAVLGSRDQMCIHPEVSREPTNAGKVHMCHHRVSNRTCHFYNNVEARKDDVTFKDSGPMDIEDLVRAGRKLQCCPYFMAKEMKQEADIVFMPYNYILDPKSRKAHSIQLENKIIILDEAHNIEKMCEESASLVLRSTDIAMCIDEVTKVMKEFGDLSQMSAQVFNSGEENLKDFTMEELCILKTLFLKFEDAVDSISVKESQKDDQSGETYPGSFMVDLLAQVGITNDKKLIVVDLLEKIVQYLTTSSMTTEGESAATSFQRRGNGLQIFSDLLKVVFSQDTDNSRHMESVKRCYKVHVMIEDPKKKKKADSWAAMKAATVKANGRIINYWCLSPGFGMQTLIEQNLRSLILTSGTLAPLPPLISELGIPINVMLENPHIIKPHQVWLGVVKNGPDGYALSSAYSSRNDPKYIASLGQTMVNISRIVPDGLLIFFPSYPLMNSCRDNWQQSGVWSRIQERKPIFVEPQSREGLNSAMAEFYAKVKDSETSGACFMAVCRGKVSEGLDFADHNGRAVVVTGLPFPPLKDPRVILKRSYLDETRRNKSLDEKSMCQSGQEWYSLEASRAVNQAIGRVIRHARDYGAIILCDKRFDSPHFKNELSAWLRPHFKSYSNFGEVVRGMRVFFKNAETMCPTQIQRSNKSQTIGSMGASFDFTLSKPVQGSGSSKEDTVNLETASTWKPEDYKSESPSTSTANNTKQGNNFFTALESTSKAIDFNSVPQSKDVKRTTKNEENGLTQTKKKLKIVPLNFNLSETYNSTEEEHSQKKDVLSEKITQNGADKDKSKKASEIAAYLKEVKKNLETSKYKIFVSGVQHYTKDHDYSKLIECLKEVFISNPGLHALFRQFHRFLRQQHQDQFDLDSIALTGKMCES